MTQGRLTEKEISRLISALKANVKAAIRSSDSIKAKLRAQLETELDMLYPVETDPVWLEQLDRCTKVWKDCQSEVKKRCDELGLPPKFQPGIEPPSWRSGWVQMVKELRAEMRRLAYAQIDQLVKERLEEMERESARVQLEIIGAGNLTAAARQFLDALPRINDLMPPISVQQVFAELIHSKPLEVHSWEKRRLPEYRPDLALDDDDDNG